MSCNNQYVFVNDTNSLSSSFSLFNHVEQQSTIIQNNNISLSMMPSSVSLPSFNHFEHPIILIKNKNNKNNINYNNNNNNSNNNNDIHSSISQTQFDSNHIVSQCHLPSNHTFIPVYNNKNNNNNNLSFNSSISIPFNVLSQSHFQLPLNHSTNNHIIFYDDKEEEEEEEEYVQWNSNSSNNTISCFNHVKHQLISINYPLPIKEEEEEEESVQLNSNSNTISFSYFNQSIPIDNNNIISFLNVHQSSIPCFKSSDILTHSTTNNHILVEEEFVQLNNSSKITHSLTCLDNVKHQSIPISNQSNNNNNNYFSLIHSSSLNSPIPFSSDYFNSANTSTSSSSTLSNTINSTRSKTSPFSRYSSNISRIENNNNAVTSSDNLNQFTDTSSFIFIDTKVANNYFDSLNCFGTNHSNHTIIQQSSSPINHHTILTTTHTHNQYSQITPPSSNNNNNSYSFIHPLLSINTDFIVPQCQSQPLISNYSTTNNLILLEEREKTVQLNSNNNNNTITISLFTHVEHYSIHNNNNHNISFHQLSDTLYQSQLSIPFIYVLSQSMSPIPLNSSDVLFHCQSPNHSTATNNFNLDQEESVQLNSSRNTISFSYFNQSIPIDNNNNNISFFNDHHHRLHEFVQLNSNSSITNSLTCLDHVKNQSILFNSNQSNNNNNYYSLIHSSISPNHFNSFSSSNTSYISNIIKSTRSIASPFKSRHSNISRLKNNPVTNNNNNTNTKLKNTNINNNNNNYANNNSSSSSSFSCFNHVETFISTNNQPKNINNNNKNNNKNNKNTKTNINNNINNNNNKNTKTNNNINNTRTTNNNNIIIFAEHFNPQSIIHSSPILKSVARPKPSDQEYQFPSTLIIILFNSFDIQLLLPKWFPSIPTLFFLYIFRCHRPCPVQSSPVHHRPSMFHVSLGFYTQKRYSITLNQVVSF
ncbi:hypothetical protein DFA_07470 [Cavenderia fasciculata]|uniref:Uncharacterized protein n=1 Tax=Cavenderia fasciculata TaxID=261658 RepID=F4PWI2_CACFS|nr:uncharacterized protein DFA_07470 [Cavenderia fasciculata]EGG20346.1 hypothetical protein DFA_07470 [Cavenderia fasciculata]|eukprot:XP_004367329.1 hypothetical protein DFA_07470 [Cavenderia fasciculata]